ncbi:phospholipid phosphatase 4 isoform X1 [Phyllostomus discolor]|uniref:Phospholipid phosphatase 4 isoform X1 n=2 Tax=Laurasiatheria TaxID=314145 RepID=A0A7E6DW90_9CHIR|nr:phospholipid phosphatase 4 isoform X1 [Phyllostomus discolor]
MRELAIEIGVRALLFGVFVFTEFLDPFQRVIQPEEIWLYKNPLVQSDNIPTRLMFAISFLTPLAVICVVKIIRRTDKTEIKEAFLAVSLALALNGVCTNTIKLIVGRWSDELGNALHGGPRPGFRGPQKLPQHPLLLCLFRPRLHDILLGRQAALLHRERPGEELEAVRRHPAAVLRHDDRPVPHVRLQAPLARFLCGRSHRPHFRVHLLPTALPAAGQHGLSQALRQPPCPGLAEERGGLAGRHRTHPASGGDHRGPRMTSAPGTTGGTDGEPGRALPPNIITQ